MLPRRVVLRSFGALGGALLIGGCSPGPLRIDVYRPEDREFFQPNRSAIEEISHPSVASLVAESFAVVTATIVDVVDLHEVRSSEDHFFEGGWVIEVHECVRSRGEPLAGRTIVSLLAGDSPLSDHPPVAVAEGGVPAVPEVQCGILAGARASAGGARPVTVGGAPGVAGGHR